MTTQTKKPTQTPTKQRVVILGAGFGGVKVALELAGHPKFSVTLISDHSDFRYYPSLYRTATGGSPAASSIALSEIFADKDIKVVKDSAQSLDRQVHQLKGSSGKNYSYDILIIALGVVTNFFGIKGLDKYAYGIKTLDDAQKLRRHLHKQLIDDHQPDLNYIVIGGGPTGVELAGALPGYINHIMRRHGLNSRPLNIDLVEAESRVLPNMPIPYSYAVTKRLKKLGVKLYLNQRVEAETTNQLMVSGQPIVSHSVIWTAGVTNHPFLKAHKFSLSRRGKVIVDHYLQAEPQIYVIGDNAETKYSGMAQTALRDGLFLATNLKRLANGRRLTSYKAQKPIYVTPVGYGWAAVLWRKTHIYGWLGWLARSVADFIGYHDLEPWWPASRHWLAGPAAEDCPLCAPAK